MLRGHFLTALEDDIIFGVLAPGTRLTEDGLMARFGVTRHSVRQALVDLERIGIVVRERNIGATVRQYRPDEVRDIYQVREFLQRQAALMIPCPPPPDLQSRLHGLNALFRDAQARADLRGVHEANDQFHLTIFEACGNRYLVRSIRDYMNLSLPMRAKSLADPAAFRISAQQHAIMIELLADPDRWSLAQLCVDHVQPSKLAYLDRVREADRRGNPAARSSLKGQRRSEMPRMMVASSPVEIEAKSEEAGFPPDAHDTARRMFHELTDRIGRATASLGAPHEEWRNHRFYFGTEGDEMSALLDGLRGRADILDVTDGWSGAASKFSGLYVRDIDAAFVGVLVAHQDHEGYRSETPTSSGGKE